MKNSLVFIILSLCMACSTQGQLEYLDHDGKLKTACVTEYVGAPSVDHFAVQYLLSYCAKQAAEKGYKVLDPSLLTLDLTIPKPINAASWTFEHATELYQQQQLTDKQYGYIIAYIDLGLAD